MTLLTQSSDAGAGLSNRAKKSEHSVQDCTLRHPGEKYSTVIERLFHST